MRKLVECKEEAYQMTHDGMPAPRSPHVFSVTAPLTGSDSCYSLLLGYLKLWQLSKPLLASFDAIFVDEAQDCTPGDKLFRTSVVSNT